MRRALNVDFYSSRLVRVAQREQLDGACVRTRALLRESHKIDNGTKDDFEVPSLIRAKAYASATASFLLPAPKAYRLMPVEALRSV